MGNETSSYLKIPAACPGTGLMFWRRMHQNLLRFAAPHFLGKNLEPWAIQSESSDSLVGGFNPSEKIWAKTRIFLKWSEHQTYLKPPPSVFLGGKDAIYKRVTLPAKLTGQTGKSPQLSIGNTSSFMVDFPASHVSFREDTCQLKQLGFQRLPRILGQLPLGSWTSKTWSLPKIAGTCLTAWCRKPCISWVYDAFFNFYSQVVASIKSN